MPRDRQGKPLVDACGYSVKELFQGHTYHLDYFQRDYVWEEPHVEKLLDDLSEKFLSQWRVEHTKEDVNFYDPYFLGPFIVYELDGETYLADGQQRLITLLLLLIYLRHLVVEVDSRSVQANLLTTLIVTEKFGRKTFAVDVDKYVECFDALVADRDYSVAGEPPYVRRIWAAYRHIVAYYPHQLRGECLPLFVEWLLHRVSLVALSAFDRDTAVEMFQSMNDRGVHLSPLDHLKRYLLSDAIDDPRLLDAQWQRMVSDLEAVERGAAFAFLQTVFRAKYAEPAEGTGPSLRDATHEWVLAHADTIWPGRKNGDRSRFVTDLLVPLKNTYVTLLRGRSRLLSGLEAVRYNAANGITDQFVLTVAAINTADSPSTRDAKARLVANFIDLFVVTRALANDPYNQKALDGVVADLLPRIRLCRSVDDLRRVLGETCRTWPEGLSGVVKLRLHNNAPFVHYFLARLTAWLEVGAQKEDPTERLLAKPSNDRGFEIEHLFTSTAATYADLVPDEEDYRRLRSRVGALVLLDGPDNGSYGGLPLVKKLQHYRSDNLLAGSLDAGFLERGRVRFRRFVKEQGLAELFTPYVDGEPLEKLVEARSHLYHAMAERIWNLDRLGLAVPTGAGGVEPPGPQRKRRNHGVHLNDLVNAGLVRVGDRLVGRRRGRSYFASVLPGGRVGTESGSVFGSLSAAAMDVLDSAAANGWTFWHLDGGERLDAVRAAFRERR